MLMGLLARGAARGRPAATCTAWAALLRGWRRRLAAERLPPPAELPGLVLSLPADQQAPALGDLIQLHLQASWERGAGRTLRDYPVPPGVDREVLMEAEFLARQRPGGDAPDPLVWRREGERMVRRLQARLCVGGRFARLRRVGIGSGTALWLLADRRRARLCVGKEGLGHATAGTALDTEARLTARLDHPAIPRFERVLATADDRAMLVQDFVADEDLHQAAVRLHRDGADPHPLLVALERVCSALEHAHERGVLHGDLKPGNILLAADGRVQLADWGCARMLGSQPSPGGGTPEYLAPECVATPPTPASEVFGLGAVLAELLDGRPVRCWPDGQRPREWWRHLGRDTLRPPAPRRGHLADLVACCRSALLPDPRRRPPDVATFATPLRRLLGLAAGPSGR